TGRSCKTRCLRRRCLFSGNLGGGASQVPPRAPPGLPRRTLLFLFGISPQRRVAGWIQAYAIPHARSKVALGPPRPPRPVPPRTKFTSRFNVKRRLKELLYVARKRCR